MRRKRASLYSLKYVRGAGGLPHLRSLKEKVSNTTLRPQCTYDRHVVYLQRRLIIVGPDAAHVMHTSGKAVYRVKLSR